MLQFAFCTLQFDPKNINQNSEVNRLLERHAPGRRALRRDPRAPAPRLGAQPPAGLASRKADLNSSLACVHQERPIFEQEMNSESTVVLKTKDLIREDELRTDIFAPKLANLNLSPEPLNLVES